MDTGPSTAVTCPSHQQPLTLSQSGCIPETTKDSRPPPQAQGRTLRNQAN